MVFFLTKHDTPNELGHRKQTFDSEYETFAPGRRLFFPHLHVLFFFMPLPQVLCFQINLCQYICILCKTLIRAHKRISSHRELCQQMTMKIRMKYTVPSCGNIGENHSNDQTSIDNTWCKINYIDVLGRVIVHILVLGSLF